MTVVVTSVRILVVCETNVLRQKINEINCQKEQILYEMTKTTVPLNLIPVASSALNEKWSFQTFPHWKAFYNGKVPSIPTTEEAQKWKEAAKDISEELKTIGVSKAHEKICDMMNSFFTFDRKNHTFCSLYDVIDFLGKPSFYKNNMDQVRNMIHMFQYGIFRVGYNAWALDAAKDWMEDRKITYNDKDTLARRKGKGFVYKLIVSRASNSIGDRLQKFTEKIFSEYLLVRDKKIKKFEKEGYECIPHVFNHRFQGYICRQKISQENTSNSEITIDQTTKLLELVDKTMQNGLTFDTIYTYLQKKLKELENGKFFIVAFKGQSNSIFRFFKLHYFVITL